MLKSSFRCLVIYIAFSLFAQVTYAEIWKELSSEQQSRLLQGEAVFVELETSESNWPKTYYYKLVKSAPDEAAAVFFDYELTHTYVEGMEKSKLVREISPAAHEVAYALSLSFLTENYVLRQTLQESQGSYRFAWSMLKSDRLKSIDGLVRFEARGAETLAAFYTYVVPDFILSGLVRGKVVNQLKEAAVSAIRQIEKEHLEQSALLEQQMKRLKWAVSRQGLLNSSGMRIETSCEFGGGEKGPAFFTDSSAYVSSSECPLD